MKEMKKEKTSGPSEVSGGNDTRKWRDSGMCAVKICQDMLDERGMLDDWTISMVVPVFKWKEDAMSFGAYRGVNQLEHGMKIVGRVLEKRIRELVKVDEKQFDFIPMKGTVDYCKEAAGIRQG